MSLLTVCQDAAVELGIATPAAILTSTDPNAVLLHRLAKAEAYELARRHDWQAMTFANAWTTTATVVQDGALPADYDRLVYDAQVWDRSRNQRLMGPTTSNQWMVLKSGVTAGVHGAWRILGGKLQIYPAPDAGLTYELEYVSKAWAVSDEGVARETFEFEADEDTTAFPEYLIKTGMIWRYRKAKGFDYSEEMSTHERQVELACSRDRGIGAQRKAPKGASSTLTMPTWPGRIEV